MKVKSYLNVPKDKVGEIIQTGIDDGAIEVTAKIDSAGEAFTVNFTK